MTPSDLDTYFPHATLAQRAAIMIYHDAGWTIEAMSPNSDNVEIHEPAYPDGVIHAWILPNGHVVSI